MHILALNSGSSSLKFGLYGVEGGRVERLAAGAADAIGTGAAVLHAEGAHGAECLQESASGMSLPAVVQRVVRWLIDSRLPCPQAIGHRLVHGGPQLGRHALINEATMHQLEAATAFAPVHTPTALSVIRLAAQHFPGLPQVACLDTTFHAHMPPVARTLPLPQELRAAGVHRYGFHGLSCESIVQQLGAALPPRLLIAHLGNGASVTAVHDGISIDTSMGLTPSGGLMMGSRSGDIDPGVLVYLMREHGLDAAALEALVDQRSGLIGVSGVSSDMRRLHDAAPANADARLAIQMFCSAAAKQLAAMCTVLNGVDLIVFTGGIGEHDADVRSSICERLAHLGVELDAALNRAANARLPGTISSGASRCAVQVWSSQEDEQIARHTALLCDAPPVSGAARPAPT